MVNTFKGPELIMTSLKERGAERNLPRKFHY